MPYEVMFGRKPRWDDSTVTKESGNATTNYIEDEAVDITIPSDPLDEFVHIEEFMHVYTFDCDPEINTLGQSSTAVSIHDTRLHQPQLQPPPIPPRPTISAILPLGSPPPIPIQPQIPTANTTTLEFQTLFPSRRESSPLSSPPPSPGQSDSETIVPHTHPCTTSINTDLLDGGSESSITYTPLEREIQQRNIHVRHQVRKKHGKQHIIERFAPDDLVSLIIHTSDNTPHHLLVLPRPILSNQV